MWLVTILPFLFLSKNYQKLQSKKTYQKFLRYHRKFNEFTIKLPKDLEKIEKYFSRFIKQSGVLKISYIDNKGSQNNQFIQVLDLMNFNQNLFIKGKVQGTLEEKLFPLKQTTILDPDLGPLNF